MAKKIAVELELSMDKWLRFYRESEKLFKTKEPREALKRLLAAAILLTIGDIDMETAKKILYEGIDYEQLLR